MNNFFFNESDYSLFRKALKTTDSEPIVINILSTDSSLKSKEDKTAEVVSARKNMSKKYEPSPFGKFFGPRKQQPVSVDMKDFSSWKNKNYRKTEKSIDDRVNSGIKFSLSDFMNDKSKGTLNELDQAKSDLQKPINQLSTSDPLYKRFSLDSYMNKLEEQTLTKDSFEQNDDILEPLGADTQSVVPDSSQDENFGFGSGINIEKFAFDDNTSGDEFKFEQEELDKFRARLDKIERDAANIKEKSNQKLIESNELSQISTGFDIDKLTDDSDEDEEMQEGSIIDTFSSVSESEPSPILDESKPKRKTFFEINKNEGASPKRFGSSVVSAIEEVDESQSSEDNEDSTNESERSIIDEFVEASESLDESGEELKETLDEEEIDESETDDLQDEDDISTEEKAKKVKSADSLDDLDDEYEEIIDEEYDESTSQKQTSKIKRSDIVTKDDLKSMSEEIIDKLTQMTRKDVEEDNLEVIDGQEQFADPYGDLSGSDNPDMMYGYTEQTTGVQGGYDETASLKAQLQELIDSNKRLDLEHGQRLREVELEKERVAAEYESRIREMEKSFKESYEDFKKQAYLDKLDRDIKLKEAETKFKKKTEKIKEEEKESYSKEKLAAILKKELKSNLNISNLEMDKRLLEVGTQLNKDNYDKLFAENTEMVKKLEEEAARALAEEEAKLAEEAEDVEEIEEVEEIDEETSAKTTRKTTTRKPAARKRKPTTRKTTTARRSPRRKIDSDIIGGINFD